ncbi:hypothetical protein C1N91_07380 [Curtobacterium sp. SGAir0471]|uniref:hypothetical protein n=1 Tax=Curtobacterium sp. SGAir0471 TaxID=2070337 RepID=UPI0010CD402E|nr:hypothetical protein [Curtobacterium sp. SGAir0471]QCR43392.1 hypothetical protein C1N91_07380 [Curtobacterium sp. SGAir0471]
MRYRLMNEYGVGWPLWDDDGPCPEGTPTLSPGVTAEVRAWTRDFDEHFDVESGWPTESAARSHERRGRLLLELVARELEPADDVVLEYWETNRRRGL